MKVRTTQIIDFWIGVPVCFGLSLLRRLNDLLDFGRARKPNKLLFIEISEMGSAIIAYSSFLRAKELFKTESLYFLVFEKNRESVELLTVFPPENIITISERSFFAFAFSVVSALYKVRRLGIDTAIDLELFSRFSAIFGFLSGARNRVGFYNYTAEGLYRGSLLTRRVFYNSHQHMALNFLALVEALAAPAGQIPLLKKDLKAAMLPMPRIQVHRDDLKRVIALLKLAHPMLSEQNRLVVFNPDPGEALPIRGWPAPYYVELARLLVKHDPSIVIAVLGLARSKPYAEALQRALPAENCIDLTGQTRTLSEVMALFSLSELLIGNDGGPAHFAVLTDIKIITLFGPETPELYGPLSERAVNIRSHFNCAPCLSAANHRHSICRDSQCLKTIQPETVAAAAFDLLEDSSDRLLPE